MTTRYQAPKGTFDILGAGAAARSELERTAQTILSRAGYERIQTPTFEATELFSRTVGEATDIVQKEMYTFEDGGGRSLTLRPEGTAPVARAYIEHGLHKQPAPVKLWYHENFFRFEAPQAGRYREFSQIGAEAIGSDDPAVDAEVIVLLSELLEAMSVKDVRLRLSSLGTPSTRERYRAQLQSYLEANIDALAPHVRERIALNPLRAFDAGDSATQAVMSGAPRLMDSLTSDERDHFASVREALEATDISYEIDSTLVRGLDYYTLTVFEFTSDALGAQSGVGGGGRYDGLIEQLGGGETPAAGWAAGVERILLASSAAAPASGPVDLYVAYTDVQYRVAAFQLATAVRTAGHSVRMELAGRSLKGQLKQAGKVGSRFVAIFGDEGVSLKDMDSGDQQVVKPEMVMHWISRSQAL